MLSCFLSFTSAFLFLLLPHGWSCLYKESGTVRPRHEVFIHVAVLFVWTLASMFPLLPHGWSASRLAPAGLLRLLFAVFCSFFSVDMGSRRSSVPTVL